MADQNDRAKAELEVERTGLLAEVARNDLRLIQLKEEEAAIPVRNEEIAARIADIEKQTKAAPAKDAKDTAKS